MKSILIFLFFSLSLAHADLKEQIPIAEAFKNFPTYQIISILKDNYSGLKYEADSKDGECLAALSNLDKLRSSVPKGWRRKMGLSGPVEMGLTLAVPKGYKFDYLYNNDTGDYEPIFTANARGKLIVVNSKGKVVVAGLSSITEKKPPTSIDFLVKSIKNSRKHLGYHKNKTVSTEVFDKVNFKINRGPNKLSVNEILWYYGMPTEEDILCQLFVLKYKEEAWRPVKIPKVKN